MELNREQIEKSKDYVEDVLKNWALWQTHHSKLTQSMRDMLVLIEVYEQKIKELTKENEELRVENKLLESQYETMYDSVENTLRAEIADCGTSCKWCENKVKADTVEKLLECAIENAVCKDNDDGTERLFISIPKLREIAKQMSEGNNER